MNAQAFRRPFLVATPLLFTALVLTGCSKFTETNLEKIHNGMTVDEVKAIFGSPTFVLGETDYLAYDGPSTGPAWEAFHADDLARHARPTWKMTYFYRNSSTQIEIDFVRDIVVTKKGTFK